MLRMISLSLLILYSLNFAYLLFWVNKTVERCTCCADAKVPATVPAPSTLSQGIFFVMFIHFIVLAYWGFTENPWLGPKGPWIHPGDALGLWVSMLIAFCLGSSGFVLYKLGKLSGIIERRNEEIYREKSRKQQEDFLRLHGGER